MLFELYKEFGDGRSETTIIHVNEGEMPKIYPQRDNIINSGCKPFKYKVDKHPTLPKIIVRFGDRTLIYPQKLECHPDTTLDDIIEVESKQQLEIKKQEKIKELVQFKTWEFKSSSSDGTYIVRETTKGLKCTCPGVWRSKDRKCRHIKEVETY